MRFFKTHRAILLSLAVFLISLTQHCITYRYFGTVKYPSFLAFLSGWMHFGGGGFSEGCVWLANPFYFGGIFLLYKQKKNTAVFLLIISFVLALSFLAFKNLTMTKSGRIAPIIELNAGYFFWLTSILSALLFSIFLKIKNI